MMMASVAVLLAALVALSAAQRGEKPKKVVIGGLFPYSLEGEDLSHLMLRPSL